jgi:hypothetical protein
MSELAVIEADIRERIEDVIAKGREVLDDHLPRLAQAAADAEGDPLIQAIEATLLPLDVRQLLASLVTKLGSDAPQVAEPADPGSLVSAGPVIGGTAG